MNTYIEEIDNKTRRYEETVAKTDDLINQSFKEKEELIDEILTYLLSYIDKIPTEYILTQLRKIQVLPRITVGIDCIHLTEINVDFECKTNCLKNALRELLVYICKRRRLNSYTILEENDHTTQCYKDTLEKIHLVSEKIQEILKVNPVDIERILALSSCGALLRIHCETLQEIHVELHRKGKGNLDER